MRCDTPPGYEQTQERGSEMSRVIRHIAGVIAVAGMFGFGSYAMAQTTVGDGLINVAVGDISVLNNADIGVAAQVAANICGVKVGPVAVLGRAVDRSGGTRTVCESGEGPVTLRQN
jgi:hypothetical protein